jgi:pSer/pThr/pTyr-binding forkhead associated (FHA) protein
MSNKLLILHADKSMEVQFDQQITIGRDVFNSLSLQDAEVSRSHAIVFEQDGETILKDLKSRNGCFVAGDKVNECTLKPGTEIILGGTVIIFNPPDDVELNGLLSKRGRYLLEKRAIKTPLERPAPTTIFSDRKSVV